MRQLPWLILLIAFPLLAQQPEEDLISADRPGIADSSSVVKPGQFQLELGFEKDGFGPVDVLTTPTLLRIGLTKALELRVETAGHASVSGLAPHDKGWMPISAGLKYRFADSYAVIARVFPPSGSGVFKSDKTAGDLRLAADFSLNDRVSLNPNIGVANDGDFTSAIAALTVQYQTTQKTNVFADAGFQTPEEKHGTYALNVDVGGAWVIGHDTQLDVSVGWGGHGRSVPDFWYGAGFSRRF
jgi:hypothetical protein